MIQVEAEKDGKAYLMSIAEWTVIERSSEGKQWTFLRSFSAYNTAQISAEQQSKTTSFQVLKSTMPSAKTTPKKSGGCGCGKK